MVYCSIVGCKNRSGQNSNCKLFKVPAVISNEGEEFKLLIEERRNLWISRINRKDITFERYTAVCSIHFIKGAPSKWHEKTSPDRVPSLNLGNDSNNLRIMKSVGSGRYVRAKGRESTRKKSKVVYADSSCMTLVTGEDLLKLHNEVKQLNISKATLTNDNGKLFEDNVKLVNMNVSLTSNFKELADNNNKLFKENEKLVKDNVALKNECVRIKEALNGLLYGTNVELADDSAGLAINIKTLANSNFKFVRANEKLITDNKILITDKKKLIKDNEKLNADNIALRNEMMKVKEELKKRTFDEDSLRNRDEKVKFYTGIPSFSRLMKIFDLVTAEVKETFDPNVHKLTRLQEFLMVLIRLRLNLFEADLGYRFDVAQSTVSRIISNWLPFMANRLKPLIV